ncbi:helix-turn-helix domain-containing protein [Staphylococcus lutrae]|uniref:Helicase Helix-turn-helix domain-containing protein n=1 Tax=Staphylococcus lutrae TaxID=155085 RepID=A0AAC9RVX9_9STAP|nr:helix-turn-helix domain-containing protein [Staphylococcus lutrae]ARJ51895.1 hypothetical protein B5P37_11485 [Staphylococcus lutrae]PNZ35957.1 hypothetical protein CD134_08755 [Staphylococcus lutrae]
MKHFIHFLYHHASAYKTKKSIFNIIIGKKTHQTFFDAVSLNVLSLFGSVPTLTPEQFEKVIRCDDVPQPILTDNHVHFQTLVKTFETLQLLVQTYSYIKHDTRAFLPITSNTDIHHKVRHLYHDIVHHDQTEAFENELFKLFETLHSTDDTPKYAHYLLTGYDEPMYTRQQICAIESIDMDDLFVALYQEYLMIYRILKQSSSFPILSQCIMSMDVSERVYKTYHLLQDTHAIPWIAKQQQVKETTVEDHILDLFMKEKLTNYADFFKSPYQPFVTYYHAHPYQRLKVYKERFEALSYFEIKLAIIGYTKGELHA